MAYKYEFFQIFFLKTTNPQKVLFYISNKYCSTSDNRADLAKYSMYFFSFSPDVLTLEWVFKSTVT
jgi:hypothetical protein